MDRCVSNKSSTATAMAIASRALRPCDVCGRERAKWFCKADEAYLCEHCDASVHGANTVSLRHERLRLGPNGQPTKSLVRDQPTAKLEAPALMQGSRKRRRSSRGPKVKVEPPDDSPNPKAAPAPAGAATAAAAAAEEFLKSFILATSEDEQFFDPDVLVRDSTHEVPIFVPPIDEVYSDDVPSDGFSVPSHSTAGADDDSPRTDHSVELCFDPFAESEGDLCDMEGIMSGTMDMEAISDLGEVLGLCDDTKELCGEAYGLDFPTDSAENAAATPSDGSEDFCSSKVKLEEADYLDKVKLEVDEMLGFAFSTNSCVKEEVPEQKPIKLRLNYEDVLNAWSDRGPFWTEGPRPQTVPDDTSFDPKSTWDTRLVPGSSMESLHIAEGVAQVPVVNFSDGVSSSGGREARVLRYREKRRTRLFSKKIRYEVRKLNAERRPRLKGRFVKRINI